MKEAFKIHRFTSVRDKGDIPDIGVSPFLFHTRDPLCCRRQNQGGPSGRNPSADGGLILTEKYYDRCVSYNLIRSPLRERQGAVEDSTGCKRCRRGYPLSLE